MEKRHAAALLLAVQLSFPGCSAVLERSYDVVEPHNSQYWEDGTSSALRAEDYQSLVNGLLMLVSNQTDAGLVRLYGYGDQASAMRAMDQACAEVTMQDPLGAYLVDYVTYDCVESAGCYEITVKIAYQKTPAQLRALVNATTAGALQELLETALQEEKTELAVKIGYMDRSAEEVSAQVAQIMEEKGMAAEDWSVRYYPDEGEVGDARIVEITWQPPSPPLPGALPEPQDLPADAFS